ncbi:N-acyl-D-amino-acid deacylase family protein [Sphingosinicella rhizophila]|uniref:Amidohydrolase family protein n=1 Tax=Sphingosinicella rhizophila TaxID=3050082 RepID=A0ABU3Q6V8_9SPHN|nr:amidohydrolase family protein [Sphingosinicella sp. GR2756]MDT9599136.1 amidohydrolase family protein [Sphingosinicella sp. GR2756]
MKLKLCAALGAVSIVTTPAAGWQATGDYDIVIRGGRVLDGAGNPWVSADVAVKDGRIAKIGKVLGRGKREVDARGRYVTPGWIDMMDQSGSVLRKNGLAENKLRTGVTTLIAGEGGTPVPAEEIAAYFKELETTGIAVNFGSYYSPTQARSAVMGDADGRPTPSQMVDMQTKVKIAMNAGTLGLATALIYPPGTFQTTQELIDITKVAAPCNAVYATHMRDESAGLLEGIKEAIAIGEGAGVKVEIFHLKASYAPKYGQLMPGAVKLVNDARARGVDIAADMYMYPFSGTGLEVTAPTWVYAKGFDEAVKLLKDPAQRTRMKADIKKGPMPGWTNMVYSVGGWNNVILANPHNPKFAKYRFKSIADIAKAEGVADPADLAWDIMLAALPKRAMAIYMSMDERDIETALKQPWVSIGSDAGAAEVYGEIDGLGLPHPRAYGNAARTIAEYVKRRNVLTLEDAVRKMTSWPAHRMGLTDRGVLREGLRADITIFDYDKLDDRAWLDKPTTSPVGIDDVIVNGQLVLADGKVTGARPGMVLKGGCAAPGAQLR